jgi:hypothetical protein
MTTYVIPAVFTLRQSGNPGHNKERDCRPMTLRHQVSLGLPFGQPVSHDQHSVLVLDAWLCVAVFWRFCFYRQSGGRGHVLGVTLDP